MQTEQVRLRDATPEDAEVMLALIQELADYEKAGDEVSLTVEGIVADGFSEQPAFQAIVAERDETILGMAVLYERYSTWKGKTLYLEDLIVTESARGQGIGEKLLKKCISMAEEGAFKRLEWQVLDWNRPAIDFYRKMGVDMDATWINCRMNFL